MTPFIAVFSPVPRVVLGGGGGVDCTCIRGSLRHVLFFSLVLGLICELIFVCYYCWQLKDVFRFLKTDFDNVFLSI